MNLNPFRRKPPAPKLPFKRRARRQAIRLVKLLLILYVGIGLMLALLQTKLIFIGASTQGSPDSLVDPPPASELLHLQSPDGAPVTALFGAALDGPAAALHRPTVLFFYGNAMCMKDALENFHDFRHAGANAMIVDYEGFGMSGGKPSEQGCYAAADAAYQHLLSRKDINPHNIVPAGWSLGAAVAIDLAARHAADNTITGVMTFSAFTSMVDTAQHHYPIFPVSLVLTHRFDSLSKIPRIHVPLLMVHGRLDDIVPFPMHARLRAAATAPVTDLTLDHAAHNDLFDTDETTLQNAIKTFLDARATP